MEILCQKLPDLQYLILTCRKRDEQLKDELRRASEEKEPLLRRGSAKDEKSPRGRRESSTSSDKIHLEEPMGPSICPDSVFQTLVIANNIFLICVV